MKGPRYTSSHGLSQLRGRVKARGLEGVDKRSAGYRAMRDFQESLVKDLGGIAELCTQQLALVELSARVWLFISHIDGWLLQQDSIMSGKGRQKRLIPVVRERQELARHFESLMGRLGLQRARRKVENLTEYLKKAEDE